MNFKLWLIRAITFFSGWYFLLEFLLPKQIPMGEGHDPFIFGLYHDQISKGFAAVAGCAAGLGLLNLLFHHGKKIIWLDKGAIYSATLLASLLLTLGVLSQDWLSTLKVGNQVSYFSMLQEFTDVVDGSKGEEKLLKEKLLKNATFQRLKEINASDPALMEKTSELTNAMNARTFEPGSFKILLQQYGQLYRAFSEQERAETVNAKISTVLIKGLFTSLGSAMFSLLGFYIAAAAYRAFRVKSFESGLLMVTALIVMLGQIAFGAMIWEGFPGLRLWLLQVPSSAAARAIEIGASIAGLILAFRMWLSIESSSFRSK